MPPRLTFGVEFEFSLATLSDEANDPVPSDCRPTLEHTLPYKKRDLASAKRRCLQRHLRRKIARTLRDVGLPTVVADDPEANDVDQSFPWAQGSWVVKHDASIQPPYDGHDWWNIEINSPPYIFSTASLEAVQLACQTLTRHFQLNVNQTCGLHVHVGNGHDGFPLATLRHLFAFLWCFEPALDRLHPPYRYNDSYFRSLRASSVLSRGRGRLSGIEILSRVLRETHASTFFRLVSDAAPGNTHIEAYNVRNLHPRRCPAPVDMLTVEFRQHEGTLDGDRAVEWIKTVVALVAWIEDVDALALTDFVTQVAAREDSRSAACPPYDVIDLLNDIGLEGPAAYWDDAIPKSVRKPPTKYYKSLKKPPGAAQK